MKRFYRFWPQKTQIRGALVTKSVTPGGIIAAVRDEIDYDLSLQDALARDYANISAVSRMMQPRISEKLGREVNIESIITSLKRLTGRVHRRRPRRSGRSSPRAS